MRTPPAKSRIYVKSSALYIGHYGNFTFYFSGQIYGYKEATLDIHMFTISNKNL